MKILLAEDEAVSRLMLSHYLESEGYDVITAQTGIEAVEAFEREQPDIILMDVIMPQMDGYEATQIIKQKAGENFIPVLFLTALNDEQQLANCVACGGDDFLTKPYSKVILRAKLEALERQRDLHTALTEERDRVQYHQNRLVQEQAVAESLFRRVVHSGCLDAENIRYHLSPMAIFNGDLLLATPRPEGGQYILLGDFTGHGLPAAVGAMPVADIFYTMTASGFSGPEILNEVNGKLRNILPTGVFLATCFIETDPELHRLWVWNGGMPDILIRGPEGIKYRIESSHVPLGIIGNKKLDIKPEHLEIAEGDRIYMYSDGVVETQNALSEMFGYDRLDGIIDKTNDPNNIFDLVLESITDFRGPEEQSDDVTLIEVVCTRKGCDAIARIDSSECNETATRWTLSFELKADALQNIDPIPVVTNMVGRIQGLDRYKRDLYVILIELFNNALDHGVLGLKSALKNSHQGFTEFYEERERRLSMLKEGWIRIDLKHHPQDSGGLLHIHIHDSGPGFEYQKPDARLEANRTAAGRGIPLVRKLCKSLEYRDVGNHVEAQYEWGMGTSKA